MSKIVLNKILNADLPSTFRNIQLELAREPGHPVGDLAIGYTIIAPLTLDGTIDANLWKKHRAACRVVRRRPNEADGVGHLVHRPGGNWAIEYDVAGGMSSEAGYHFSDEHFVVGEYVSIKESDQFHTFRVASVSPL